MVRRCNFGELGPDSLDPDTERVAKALRDADFLRDVVLSPKERVDWDAAWEEYKITDPWIVEKWMKTARVAMEAMQVAELKWKIAERDRTIVRLIADLAAYRWRDNPGQGGL